MNAKTLVIVEHDNQSLIADTLKTLSAAASLSTEVSALVVGEIASQWLSRSLKLGW